MIAKKLILPINERTGASSRIIGKVSFFAIKLSTREQSATFMITGATENSSGEGYAFTTRRCGMQGCTTAHAQNLHMLPVTKMANSRPQSGIKGHPVLLLAVFTSRLVNTEWHFGEFLH